MVFYSETCFVDLSPGHQSYVVVNNNFLENEMILIVCLLLVLEAVSFSIEGKDVWRFFQLILEKSLIYKILSWRRKSKECFPSLVVLLANVLSW